MTGKFNIVLPPDVVADDRIYQAVDSVCAEVNPALQLRFTYDRSEQPGPGVTSRIWEDRAYASGSIHLVEDRNIPAVYVSPFLVESEAGHHTILKALRSHVPFVPVETLRSQATHGEPNFPTALMRLGIGETAPFNEQTVAAIVAGLRNTELEVRRAAAMAAFLLKWSDFRSALNEAIAIEKDADLLAQLEVAREYLKSNIILL